MQLLCQLDAVLKFNLDSSDSLLKLLLRLQQSLSLNIFLANEIDLDCFKSIINFLSFSEKSPSGPIRIQIGPKNFF